MKKKIPVYLDKEHVNTIDKRRKTKGLNRSTYIRTLILNQLNKDD